MAQRFEDDTPPKYHPHYGRFLELVPHKLVVLTWVTFGTAGAQTTLSVSFTPDASGTLIVLTHGLHGTPLPVLAFPPSPAFYERQCKINGASVIRLCGNALQFASIDTCNHDCR